MSDDKMRLNLTGKDFEVSKADAVEVARDILGTVNKYVQPMTKTNDYMNQEELDSFLKQELQKTEQATQKPKEELESRIQNIMTDLIVVAGGLQISLESDDGTEYVNLYKVETSSVVDSSLDKLITLLFDFAEETNQPKYCLLAIDILNIMHHQKTFYIVDAMCDGDSTQGIVADPHKALIYVLQLALKIPSVKPYAITFAEQLNLKLE